MLRHLLRQNPSCHHNKLLLWWQKSPFHPLSFLSLIPPHLAHVIHQTTMETDANLTAFEREKSRENQFLFSHKFPRYKEILSLASSSRLSQTSKACASSLDWKWKSWSYFTFIVIVYQYFSELANTQCSMESSKCSHLNVTLQFLSLDILFWEWCRNVSRVDYFIKEPSEKIFIFLLLALPNSDMKHQKWYVC